MSSSPNIDPDVFVILGSLLAILISQNMSSADINVLGNFLAQVASSLLAKAAQQQSLESKEELKKQIADMELQIKKLKRQLC